MNNYENTTYKETIFKRGLRKHKLILKQSGNIFYKITYTGKAKNNFTLHFNKELAFNEFKFLTDTIENIYNNKDIDNFIKLYINDNSF